MWKLYLSEVCAEKHSDDRRMPSGLCYASSDMQGWRLHMEDGNVAEFDLDARMHCDRGADVVMSKDCSDASGDVVIDTDIQEIPDPKLPVVLDKDSGHTKELSDPKRVKIEDPNRGWPEGTHIFAVFDGNGGKGVSHYLKHHLVDAICQEWRQGVDVQNAITAAFKAIDMKLDEPDVRQEICKLNNIPNYAPDHDIFVRKPKGDNYIESPCMMYQSRTRPDYLVVNSAQLEETRSTTPEGIGSTVILIVYLPPTVECPYGKLVCANLGDSRAVLCQGNQALQLSIDNDPFDPDEFERITKAGGTVSKIHTFTRVCKDLMFSRSIGNLRYKKNPELRQEDQIVSCVPTFSDVVLAQDDRFFVLACDGLWDSAKNQTVVDFINRKLKYLKPDDKLSTITESLLDDTVNPVLDEYIGLGMDNISVQLIKLAHAN